MYKNNVTFVDSVQEIEHFFSNIRPDRLYYQRFNVTQRTFNR